MGVVFLRVLAADLAEVGGDDVMVVDVSKKNIAPFVRPDKKSNADGAAQ